MKRVSPPLPDKTFFRLAAGEGGAEAMGCLCAAQRAKTRLLVRGVAVEAPRAGHVHADLAVDAYDLLSGLETSVADEVDRVIRYPPVSAWALRTYRSLREGTGAPDDPGHLAALVVTVAIRSRTTSRVRLPVVEGTITLPSLGRLVLPAGTEGVVDVVVRPAEGGIELEIDRSTIRLDPYRDSPGWLALRRLPVTPEFSLVVDDLDPYRWSVRDVATPRLTSEGHRRWKSCVRDAWRILTAHHPHVAQEIAAGISVLTPIRGPAHGQDSASSRETFGTIALSEPPNGLALAVTFAHEVQHAKLTALTDMIDLTRPDDGQRYYAPWRDDPRPAYGLLQGAYAYLGVAEFWRRQRRFERGPGAFQAQVELARWRDAAYLVTGTLMSSGRLTEQGTEFVDGMRGTLERCLSESVDPAAAHEARRKADRHAEAWNKRNT
jgi:HEXXH motif-containing protein